METLVRRLGRIFSLTKDSGRRPAKHRFSRRVARLETALDAWLKDKGWRVPVRTLGEAAERLGTDTGTLHAYCKEHMGLDFRTWRNRLRLEDAKQMLLEHPEMEAADIARRVGFSNRSNFARQFLAYTGLTPKEWRDSKKSLYLCTPNSN